MPLLVALAPVSVVGVYQTHQIEIGAALWLRKDHRFRYQLDYGAISEVAEGTWAMNGKTVRLTSNPMPKAPSFELVRDDPAPEGEVMMTLEPPGFGEDFKFDAVATDAVSGEKGMVTIDSAGRVDSGGHTISSLDPLVPVYQITGGHFPLSAGRGHHLLLRFHANDIGRAAFDGEPLAVTSGGLVLKRYDAEIRFVRVRR